MGKLDRHNDQRISEILILNRTVETTRLSEACLNLNTGHIQNKLFCIKSVYTLLKRLFSKFSKCFIKLAFYHVYILMDSGISFE